MASNNNAYIAGFVRAEDRDRYLTALFAPRPVRSDLLALYAFNAEIARIRGTVSEPIIGRMRLQWWRDIIAAIYDGGTVPQGNPIVSSLAACVARRRLSRTHFESLLSVRERDFADEELQNLIRDSQELETYASGTSGGLQILAAEVLGANSPPEITAANHVGIAWAMTGLARAVLFHAAEQRIFITADRLAEAGITADTLSHAKNRHAVKSLVRAMVDTARRHLTDARALKVARAAVPALLPATIADDYLKTLAQAEYDPGDIRVVRARPSIIRLMWNGMRGAY
ncbi:MAG: squalene/phytoene synthase family protein [Rhodobacteraceae bacterium]|nr:squalene/phytoene synthase family protein [Paracoccaceae bacterium]